ncbi:hypothetical protein DS906_20285 [Ruegeria sp. A3M17]|nr:hypothetical protein DS906_20285 [Ruegeria sp. A3M17]
MSEFTVNLIGASRVGQTLLTLFNVLDYCRVQDVYSASQSSAEKAVRRAGAGRVATDLSEMRAANLWIITVPAHKFLSLHLTSLQRVWQRTAQPNDP